MFFYFFFLFYFLPWVHLSSRRVTLAGRSGEAVGRPCSVSSSPCRGGDVFIWCGMRPQPEVVRGNYLLVVPRRLAEHPPCREGSPLIYDHFKPAHTMKAVSCGNSPSWKNTTFTFFFSFFFLPTFKRKRGGGENSPVQILQCAFKPEAANTRPLLTSCLFSCVTHSHQISDYCARLEEHMGEFRWNAATWQTVQKAERRDSGARQKKHWVCWHRRWRTSLRIRRTPRHPLAYYSLIRNIFFLSWTDWQSPTSHPTSHGPGSVRADQKTFLHISRRQGRKEKKRRREEKSQKGAYCSLFPWAFGWMRTFHNALFSFFLLSFFRWRKKNKD